MSKMDPAQELVRHLRECLQAGSFARLTLSRPTDPETSPQKIMVRCVEVRGALVLSLTHRFATRDETRNLPIDEAVAWISQRLGPAFRSAILSTTQGDWQFFQSESGKSRLVSHKASVTKSPPRAHDEKRAGILDDRAQDWLGGLGITDRAGKVRERMADKYRQVNRYLEIISHLALAAGWKKGNAITIADMGAGKGYLTFGLWHLFRRQLGIPASIIGVETRADLVQKTNSLARAIRADGLEFVAGEIESTSLPPVNGLIALHACNTATDAAILKGIESGAKLIVVAPCCHQELRPQMRPPDLLAPILRHGLMEERMAEWITDGLRALYLEWAGFDTKIFEFVSSEHTAKNVMISAVLTTAPFSNDAVKQKIAAIKSHFGVKHHALDPLVDRS